MTLDFQLHQTMTNVFGIVLFAATLSASAADNVGTAVSEKAVQKFKELDHDGNGRLSSDEFVTRREPADLYRRDFLIFDFDHDHSLSLDEFAPMRAESMGRSADPFLIRWCSWWSRLPLTWTRI